MGKRKRGAKEHPTAANGQLPKRTKTSEPQSNAAVITAKIQQLARIALKKKEHFADVLGADDRKEEGALYDLLGSEDDKDRVDAAGCIVARLLDGDGAPQTVLERHLDKRLFRGLASGRNASRLGFSLAITEILCQLYGDKAMAADRYPSLTFEKTLDMLVQRTEPTHDTIKQEERDNYFGRLFGLEAFVKAGILSDPSHWLSVLNLILALSSKKVWIRSQCGWLIVQAIASMDKATAMKTLERLAETDLANTSEGVAIWITASNRFPDLAVEPWGDPFSGKRLNKLSLILRESTKDDSSITSSSSSISISTSTSTSPQSNDLSSKPTKQPNWTAQLHFVWDIIIERLLAVDEDVFGTFWQTVVDDGFFSKTATDGQKFRGFMVLQATMKAFANKGDLPSAVFSPKMMTSLMNQAAKEDRYLHRAALKALKTIEGLAGSNPDFVLPLLKGLLGVNGDFAFDQRTRTKTAEKVIGRTKPEQEKKVVNFLRKQLLASLKEEQGATGRVRTYIDYLARIVQSMSIEHVTHVAAIALGEICQLAYSTPDGIPETLLTEQTREVCRKRLEAVFAKLINNKTDDDFGNLIKSICSIDPKTLNMSKELRSRVKATLKQTKALASCTKGAKLSAEVSIALSLLYAVAILQLYNQDPDALNTIDDLDSFHERLTSEEPMAGGSEFLVETLLALVVRPSSLMRLVSRKVFEVFSEHISEKALKLLTDPLLRDEGLRGQAELFDMVNDDDDDDMDMDEEDPEEDELDASSLGFSKLDGIQNGDNDDDDNDVKSADEDDKDGENDDEDEDQDEGEDEGATACGNFEVDDPEALDKALESLLNTHRLDKDADASDGEGSDISDSEMLALDEKIAAAFKQRVKIQSHNSKKEKKDAKETVVNFKNRILDLLDIYVRAQPINPLAFTILIPLLQLVRTTSTKPLANRASELIQLHLRSIRKSRQADDEGLRDRLELDALVTLLGEIHVEASRDLSHAFVKAASTASLVVVSAMFELDKKSVETAAALYATTQSAWVLGEVKLQPSFFTEWVNWCQSHAPK